MNGNGVVQRDEKNNERLYVELVDGRYLLGEMYDFSMTMRVYYYRNIQGYLKSNNIDDLKKLKKESEKYYGFKDEWYVFGSFEPIHPDAIRVRKNENAKKAGVKQIRIHDFRHSCASLLINKGADVTMVAKYLGHAKIEETLNTYSHVFQTKLDDIVNRINNLSK